MHYLLIIHKNKIFILICETDHFSNFDSGQINNPEALLELDQVENHNTEIRKQGRNMSDKTFNEAVKKHFKTLKQYVPVVDRVHGAHHPEFHAVKTLFESMAAKVKAAGSKKPELDEEFAKLREVTSNYTVPDDVCESYEAVYNMLAEVDEAYQA